MPRGMVITVGIGKGIEHAIALSIRYSNPEQVVFVVSKQSEATLSRIQQIAQELGIPLPPYEVETVSDENKVEIAYIHAANAIKKLVSKGISPSEITVDYTSGSKPMSAGALYAATMQGCGSIMYIGGIRERDTGRVISGTEEFLTYRPLELFALRTYSEATKLFDAHHFRAARELIEHFLGPYQLHYASQICRELTVIRDLCAAYGAWDAFDHISAHEAFSKVDDMLLEGLAAASRIQKNRTWVGRIVSKLKSDDPMKRLCVELLVDLWANALRRLEERRFVDAVARFYRLTELVAQFRLWEKFKINTSNVDLDKVPECMREEIERHRNENGIIQIGLQKSYNLLEALGDEIGKAWAQPRLRDALYARNNSIGGHGLEPVTEKVAVQLKDALETILTELLPNLGSLLREARFPTLTPECR